MKRVLKQMLGWGMMLSLPLMMTSCGELFDMLDNPITPALQVLRAQLTLKVGESKPIQASTQAHVVLLYSSDTPAVATVDATGLITAVSPGTARITIKAQGEDDYYRTEIFSENTTTVEVTVTKKDGSISFATASVPKYINDPKFTNALTTEGDGVVTYTSDNTTVAEVDATTGEVTIKGVGTANIKATTTNTDTYAYKTNTAQYTLTVTKKDGSISFATASVPKYINDPKFTNALTTEGDGVVTYTSDNTTVAEVDATTGEVTIKGVGTANIKATTTDTDTYAYETTTAQYALTVDPAINLASLTANYTAQNGDVLTGTLAGKYKISIAANANVELKDVTINGVNNASYDWAGLTCLGNANITITGTNTIKAFYTDHPGIQAGKTGSTLTIDGTGSLTAIGGDWGAGIGSGYNHTACGNITINGGTIFSSSGYGAGIGSGQNFSSCGNIVINGGIINASTNGWGAGIGSGFSNSTCGDITISGGTITASSGEKGAGIGSGNFSSFGSITITSGITNVKATSNHADAWPIGKGNIDQSSSSSQVKIAGVIVTSKSWDGTGLSGTGLTLTGAGTNTWTLDHPTAP